MGRPRKRQTAVESSSEIAQRVKSTEQEEEEEDEEEEEEDEERKNWKTTTV